MKRLLLVVQTDKKTTVQQEADHDLFAILAQEIQQDGPGLLLQGTDIVVHMLTDNARDATCQSTGFVIQSTGRRTSVSQGQEVLRSLKGEGVLVEKRRYDKVDNLL